MTQIWQLQNTAIQPDVLCWRLRDASGAHLSFRDVADLWRDDEAFRSQWTRLLREVPFSGYCWECPSLTRDQLDDPFECVLVESRTLVGHRPDANAFAKYFGQRAKVAKFHNLGNDALLLAPMPCGPSVDCSHLAAFVRSAPQAASSALWAQTGQALSREIGDKAIWLSTAGHGIAWLHVRLDDRPKYYRYRPYTQQRRTFRRYLA